MKKIYNAILTIGIVLFCGVNVHATTTSEAEPNDSVSSAQLIQRNNEYPAEIVTGNYNSQKIINSNITSTADEDWYKVYLPSNSNTILGINSSELSGTGIFDIYDENSNLVKSILHQKNAAYMGCTPYLVEIKTSGYYYVRVHSTLRTGNYKFFIGGPDYAINSYTYKAPSAVTLTKTATSAQATYDLSNVQSIPENAVVYHVSIQGLKNGSAMDQNRSLKIAGDSYLINTSSYSYVADVPVINNKILKNQWTFKLDGRVSYSSSSFSLVPEITFNYIYPVLP